MRENPLTPIEPPKVPETVQPYYRPEEVQIVLKSLRGRRLRGVDAARTRAILLVLFDTGLRASELCALRVEDADWESQTIVVREAKGGNGRIVSLGTAAMRGLMSHLRLWATDSPWLFATLDGNRLTRNALRLGLLRHGENASIIPRNTVDSDRGLGVADSFAVAGHARHRSRCQYHRQ